LSSRVTSAYNHVTRFVMQAIRHHDAAISRAAALSEDH